MGVEYVVTGVNTYPAKDTITMTTIQTQKVDRVVLHDGRAMPAALVRATEQALRTLKQHYPKILADAFSVAADPQHHVVTEPMARQMLRLQGLTCGQHPNGTMRMHPLVRAIVQNASDGRGGFRSPAKESTR
jgi:hypothetical protein